MSAPCTHWADCWREHPACAVALLEHVWPLLRRVVDGGHGVKCATLIGYECDCGWNEAREIVGEEESHDGE